MLVGLAAGSWSTVDGGPKCSRRRSQQPKLIVTKISLYNYRPEAADCPERGGMWIGIGLCVAVGQQLVLAIKTILATDKPGGVVAASVPGTRHLLIELGRHRRSEMDTWDGSPSNQLRGCTKSDHRRAQRGAAICQAPKLRGRCLRWTLGDCPDSNVAGVAGQLTLPFVHEPDRNNDEDKCEHIGWRGDARALELVSAADCDPSTTNLSVTTLSVVAVMVYPLATQNKHTLA